MSPRLELRVPTLLHVRTPRPFRTQPAPASGIGFKTAGFVFYTWNQSDATDHRVSQVTAAPHIRGYNYDTVWKPFFLSRGLTIGTSDLDENDPGGPVHVYEYTGTGSYSGQPMVQLRGEAVFHFASGVNYFFSGHGYGGGAGDGGGPGSHIQYIKSLSQIGTKCYIGFFNFESIPQPVQWNQRMAAPQTAGIPYVLDAETTDCAQPDAQPNLNSYRCSAIDKYENSNRTGSVCTNTYPAGSVACPHTPSHGSLPAQATLGGVHTWEVDVRDINYLNDIRDALSQDFSAAYAPTEYDGQLWDNCIEDPYLANAQNNFPASYTSAAYRGTRSATHSLRSGWKGHLQNLQELYATSPPDFLWQNHMNLNPAGLNAYSAQDAPCRFLEFAFRVNGSGSSAHDTLANMKAKIQVAKDNALTIILNTQFGDGLGSTAWATSVGPGGVSGTWAELLAYAESIGAKENVVCMVGRNSNHMYHQTGMTKPGGGV